MKAMLRHLTLLSASLLLLWSCADVPIDAGEEGPQVDEATQAILATDDAVFGVPKPLPAGPQCGGFLGTPCPGMGLCKDDPRDDCDPRAGGADCSGVCVCRATNSCPLGSVFDSNPAVCACRPKVPICRGNPCAFTDCVVGRKCVVDSACHATCVPNPGACPVCPPGRFCPQFCPAPAE